MAALAGTPGVGRAIFDVGPGCVLAGAEEGRGLFGELVGAQRVDAAALLVIVLFCGAPKD